MMARPCQYISLVTSYPVSLTLHGENVGAFHVVEVACHWEHDLAK